MGEWRVVKVVAGSQVGEWQVMKSRVGEWRVVKVVGSEEVGGDWPAVEVTHVGSVAGDHITVRQSRAAMVLSGFQNCETELDAIMFDRMQI